jgi:hypothetical protein
MIRTLLALLVTCALVACASTRSSGRSPAVSECLAQCQPVTAPPGPFDQNAGQRDQRSDCERRCEAK